jgi:inhibitor of cysteine peptidase
MLVDQSYAGKSIDLPVGQTVEIRLQENPSTGFRWSIASDGTPQCTVVADSYQSQPGPPGQAGVHVWDLRGVQPGQCTFEVRYSRSWEHVPAAQDFVLHVRVG